MPRKVGKLIQELENINIKIECLLEDHGVVDQNITMCIGQALDELIEVNDELDAQQEE
jgi:hypothetical protein